MEKIFNISNLDNNTLDQYESFLNRFQVWPQYKRELRLSTLLNEGEKIEFTINMDSHILGAHYIDIVENEEDLSQITDIRLQMACATIKDVKFILKENNVESLEINIKFLDTQWGKICKKLLETNFDLSLKQLIQPNFIKFYITYPSKSDMNYTLAKILYK